MCLVSSQPKEGGRRVPQINGTLQRHGFRDGGIGGEDGEERGGVTLSRADEKEPLAFHADASESGSAPPQPSTAPTVRSLPERASMDTSVGCE